MITKTTRKMPVGGRTPINAGTSITSGVRNRETKRKVNASTNVQLNPAQKAFCRQLQSNIRRNTAITAATNTSNIMARPEFIDLLPLFVQKLLILDVFGSVAMKSRQQLVPYFKVVADNTKGETTQGDIMNSPFVNRQGIDRHFTGKTVKGEVFEMNTGLGRIAYIPVLPGSVTIKAKDGTAYVDNNNGELVDESNTVKGYIDYSTGSIQITGSTDTEATATYQYDNETVGPDSEGRYGARMGKLALQLDEFNLVAEAHQLACYWSIYSAFAASQEYGANLESMAKEAAFSELTAEINAKGFEELRKAAQYKPQFNWDASAVLSGSVVPTDYLNMFKLKLGQAASSVYQTTRLARPNTLTVGANVAEYVKMLNGFNGNAIDDTVGPYKLGTLDEFNVFVAPDYDPNTWVMSAKSADLRRNSALFGEYMPLTSTDAIGLANMSNQQGYATMYSMKVVNPDTVVSGKILGIF